MAAAYPRALLNDMHGAGRHPRRRRAAARRIALRAWPRRAGARRPVCEREAIDLEPEMIAVAKAEAARRGVANVT